MIVDSPVYVNVFLTGLDDLFLSCLAREIILWSFEPLVLLSRPVHFSFVDLATSNILAITLSNCF